MEGQGSAAARQRGRRREESFPLLFFKYGETSPNRWRLFLRDVGALVQRDHRCSAAAGHEDGLRSTIYNYAYIQLEVKRTKGNTSLFLYLRLLLLEEETKK